MHTVGLHYPDSDKNLGSLTDTHHEHQWLFKETEADYAFTKESIHGTPSKEASLQRASIDLTYRTGDPDQSYFIRRYCAKEVRERKSAGSGFNPFRWDSYLSVCLYSEAANVFKNT